MSIKIRRIIMFSFIGAFFILAPIILFYASGYRLDLKRYQIIKTGTLFIEAKNIKNAKLYLNNKLQVGTFSDKKFIYNLMPGDYQVKLAKLGYHDWQKNALIYSGLTSFIQDAVLFKDEVPLQLVDGQISDFALSPDWQKLVYISKKNNFDEIYGTDSQGQNATLLYRLAGQDGPLALSWASSSRKVMFQAGQTYVILDVQNPKNNLALSSISTKNFDSIVWDLSNDNLAYGEFQNAIYKLDLFEKKETVIFAPKDVKLRPALFIEGNNLYYVQQGDSQDVLSKYDLNAKTNFQLLNLSQATNYQFLTSTNNYLGVIDENAQKLYLVQKSNASLGVNPNEVPVREFNAKNAIWDDNQKQLLIYDDFEISTFNTDENQTNFINRYGQVIKKISWYPDLEHLVIMFDTNIDVIDTTQEAGTRNAIQLVKFDKINNFFLDKNGAKLYFNGQVGKQQGLYELPLQ